MRKAAEGCRLRRAAAGLAAALLTAGLVVVAAGCRSAAPNESGGGTAITRPSQASPDVLDETSEGTPEDAVQTPDGSAPPDSPATQAENQRADAPEDGAAETVPEDQAVKLELYRRQPEDNEKFTARDLLPGDSLTRYFAVRAYHDRLTLHLETAFCAAELTGAPTTTTAPAGNALTGDEPTDTPDDTDGSTTTSAQADTTSAETSGTTAETTAETAAPTVPETGGSGDTQPSADPTGDGESAAGGQTTESSAGTDPTSADPSDPTTDPSAPTDSADTPAGEDGSNPSADPAD